MNQEQDMTGKKMRSCSFSFQLMGLTALSELLYLLLIYLLSLSDGRCLWFTAALMVIIFPPAIAIIPYRFLRKKQPESTDKKVIITTLSVGFFLGIVLYPCGLYLLIDHPIKDIWILIVISVFRYFFNTGLFFSSYNLFNREENRWLYLMFGLWYLDFMIYWLLTLIMLLYYH